ncbi:DUF4276 family protein [Massilia sp. BKSP1R2A-1]|uniref:DUF4276 family protein n=1 Tax=Massilia sp. BKSP1R2A-1 TaxID=3422595 RepID=UPI003D334A2E
MTRLAISVEGATEREFVQRVLKPYLTPFGKQVTAIDLRGNVSLDKMAGQLPALFGSFDRVSTLYDFYGFKGRGTLSVDELEAEMVARVGEGRGQRFLPYIQKYEFEALLFAVPAHVVEWLSGGDAELVLLNDAVHRSGSPENVNGAVETSPSHRLKNIFKAYDKKLHGPEILELAGLQEIRAHCPRFDMWVTRLEAL